MLTYTAIIQEIILIYQLGYNKKIKKILGFFSLKQIYYLFIYLFIFVCVFNHNQRMIWGFPATGIFPANKDSECAFMFIYNWD